MNHSMQFGHFLTQIVNIVFDHALHLDLGGKFGDRFGQGDDRRFDFGKTFVDRSRPKNGTKRWEMPVERKKENLMSKFECRNDGIGATLRKRCLRPLYSTWEELLDLKLPRADSMSTSRSFRRSLYII